jgi:hypothetical protein
VGELADALEMARGYWSLTAGSRERAHLNEDSTKPPRCSFAGPPRVPPADSDSQVSVVSFS